MCKFNACCTQNPVGTNVEILIVGKCLYVYVTKFLHKCVRIVVDFIHNRQRRQLYNGPTERQSVGKVVVSRVVWSTGNNYLPLVEMYISMHA